ncbi:hypothetical protein [Flavobacterium lindanitolerans]|uniref:hypothetical protein n=1 Tax=Flavobacterium lindanitolerans TaxID=428988 RepID=UPI0011F889A5|nr:hypothetical protein [Flavobacterium lindanitolerans]THD34180.1 MAG: hypothetical protein DI588_03285 [Flavobacterium johnsoniae]
MTHEKIIPCQVLPIGKKDFSSNHSIKHWKTKILDRAFIAISKCFALCQWADMGNKKAVLAALL